MRTRPHFLYLSWPTAFLTIFQLLQPVSHRVRLQQGHERCHLASSEDLRWPQSGLNVCNTPTALGHTHRDFGGVFFASAAADASRLDPRQAITFASRLGPLCEPYSNPTMALRASAIPNPRQVKKMFWLHVPKTGTSFGPSVVRHFPSLLLV